MLTRRHLLATAAALTLAGGAGVSVVVGSWWDQRADAPYAYLSDDEAAIFDALAEAIFPAGGEPALGGGAASVPRYVDALIAGMVPLQRNLFRLALHGLDTAALAQSGASLSAQGPERVAALLRGWLTASDANVRGVAQSLHIFVGMAYLTHPQVAPVLAPQFLCGFGADAGGFDAR